MNDPIRLKRAFQAVRDLEYATDAAHHADQLVEVGRGNCHAKAGLLSRSLTSLGCHTRIVRWAYRLSDPYAHLLPGDRDIHTAVEVLADDGWIVVDPTFDSALGNVFPVNEWDTRTATAPAFEPVSPRWVVGLDDDAIEAEGLEIAVRLSGHDCTEYSTRFNDWLSSIRRGRAWLVSTTPT